jgi:acetate---CoA ligase (ADP-forming) subunit beta
VKKDTDQSTISKWIDRAFDSGRKSLLEHEAESVAREYGIKVPPSGLARNEKEALAFARRIGYPLVMKIVSQDILHKSDVGGVKTDVSSQKDVTASFKEILRNAKKSNPKARIEGILVQKQAEKSHEFVVGATRDPQFGPTIMFGLGGIYVELFKDVAFRLAPVSSEEALDMIKETKSYKLLTGFRGSAPLDINAATDTIRAVGELMVREPHVESLDINPLFVYEKGSLAVDVRIILEQKAPLVQPAKF